MVVPRQELVQALQLLDMNVYNNVFIGEQNGQGKPGSGAAACSAPAAEHLGMQPLVLHFSTFSCSLLAAGRRGVSRTRTHSRVATQSDRELRMPPWGPWHQRTTASYVYQV